MDFSRDKLLSLLSLGITRHLMESPTLFVSFMYLNTNQIYPSSNCVWIHIINLLIIMISLLHRTS